jgi:hypothetical protein
MDVRWEMRKDDRVLPKTMKSRFMAGYALQGLGLHPGKRSYVLAVLRGKMTDTTHIFVFFRNRGTGR